MPRKVRQLIEDLQQAGFRLIPGGKGSHRKYQHPKDPEIIVISGQTGDDAHHYQEKKVRYIIRKIRP